jgi:hypothetical protein
LVELELAVPAPAETGRFVLALDMVAELVCWFQQHGSEPARIEVETRG